MNGNSVILRARPIQKAKIRLFCIPYSGATAAIYFSWSEILPADIELCSIQLPGRGTRLGESLKTRISDMVLDILEGMEDYLDRPYAFFGHSLGALLSYEVTRELRRRSKYLPLHLFVSGHGGPHIPDPNQPIHALPDAELISKLAQMNGMSPEVLNNKELMELVLPIIRADFEACETYVYSEDEPFEIPISAFCGLEDPYVSRDDLEGWGKHTTRKFTVRFFPGDHFYLNVSKILLLQVITRELSYYL